MAVVAGRKSNSRRNNRNTNNVSSTSSSNNTWSSGHLRLTSRGSVATQSRVWKYASSYLHQLNHLTPRDWPLTVIEWIEVGTLNHKQVKTMTHLIDVCCYLAWYLVLRGKKQFVLFKDASRAHRFSYHWLLDTNHVIVTFFFRGNLLSTHRLQFPISGKRTCVWTFPQIGQHIPQPLMDHLEQKIKSA